MSGEVVRTKNFAADAANFIVDLAHKALAERNEFRIALSGGNTPRPVYSEIARIGRDLPWERTLITFGDERCVPPDDAQSNFRMARAFYVSTHQPCTTRLLSGECEEGGEVDRARNWRRSAVSGVASKSDRRKADLDVRRTVAASL